MLPGWEIDSTSDKIEKERREPSRIMCGSVRVQKVQAPGGPELMKDHWPELLRQHAKNGVDQETVHDALGNHILLLAHSAAWQGL